ncbi:hypothetical protein ACQV5M_02045 [Leptospira sp. SA-E8]|uniref:hypothetical protein n=1 Tax=Leptospira sp. SA-E8 TaxID=3422259 RepID=UPI003EBF778E
MNASEILQNEFYLILKNPGVSEELIRKSWEEIRSRYSKQIREEYDIYPDELYKPGRKKVLEYFLSMDSIFKTKEYREKKEKQARENLSWELGIL